MTVLLLTFNMNFLTVLDIMYMLLATVCYGLMGNRTTENILFSLSGRTVEIVLILILLHFLFAFNIVMNPLMQRLEEAVNASIREFVF